ncbi:MAG: PqqD family protein [Pseudomonadota bacterium]
MGDQIVAMSVAKGKYFALKGTAQRVWELLETPRTRVELAALLAGEYAVSIPDCEADLTPFLSDMIQNGLIVETAP